MKNEHENEEFVERLRRALDEGSGRLPPGTVSRLNQARHRALEAVGRQTPRSWWGLKPAAVLAVCTVVLVIGLVLQRPTPPPATAALEDVEILATAEDFEFYEELDFFTWLTEVRADAG